MRAACAKPSTGTVTKWPWRGPIHKAKLYSRGAQPNIQMWYNLLGKEGGRVKKAGKNGINELSQIKPCSYCTLETCCHGKSKAEIGRESFKRPLEVKERKSGDRSHTPKPVTIAICNFIKEKRALLCKKPETCPPLFILLTTFIWNNLHIGFYSLQ